MPSLEEYSKEIQKRYALCSANRWKKSEMQICATHLVDLRNEIDDVLKVMQYYSIKPIDLATKTVLESVQENLTFISNRLLEASCE